LLLLPLCCFVATAAVIAIVAAVVQGRMYSDGVYEGTSKIFRTGAAIYTAVVVARSTGKW
jgi:hypothetical protein